MLPILTIIIPSYNIENYVDECLPKYIDTRFFGLLKIIIIDDGATDRTQERAMRFVDSYPQLFEFVHKENGGHGSVINYGVQKCTKTKYFKIIDGDDWVDKEELFKLLNYLKTTDSDLIVNDYCERFSDGSIRKKICCLADKNHIELDDLILTIHSITFKTTVFKQNNIKVREGVFYEDNEFVLFPLRYVKNISYLPLSVYQYRLGNVNQSVSLNSRLKRYSDLELVESDIMNEYLNISAIDPSNQCLAKFENSLFYFFLNDYIYSLTISNSKKEYKERIDKLEKRRNSFVKIYKMLCNNRKYKLLISRLIPFRLLKAVLCGRFS